MPIKNYPFFKTGRKSYPALWIRAINPHKHMAFIALARIDTGADDCAFPAEVALQLGHDLEKVNPKEIVTASGKTCAFPHTTKIEVLEMLPDGKPGQKVLHTIPNTLIDYTKGLQAFLLGTKSFLSKFVLKIDYPNETLSLRLPPPEK